MNFFLMALAMMPLLSSCEDEDAIEQFSDKGIGVTANFPGFKGVGTRAVEKTTENFGSFALTAFIDGHDNYMDLVRYYKQNDGSWSTDGTINEGSKFYWPSKSALNFFAVSCPSGGMEINKDKQRMCYVTPDYASQQEDIVVASEYNGYGVNGNSGYPSKLTLDFKHVFSEISFQLKNDNTKYSVTVKNISINNIKRAGNYIYANHNNQQDGWTLEPDKSNCTYIETPEGYSNLADFNEAIEKNSFMLLPQQLESSSVASQGACVAIDIKVVDNKGKSLYEGTSYIPISSKWEMGYHYTYNLDFTNGVGQDVDGNEIELSKDINANCIILDVNNTDKVYGIDVSRANTFWSNSDVGDASNVIDHNTKWTAEVIWQDIPSRAINFCDKSGATVSGDTYSGNGLQPLYVKAASGQKGNVVVGIKKKGAGSDAYLWSWHLWLTDEPQLISGFMDRNLGATSATPSDGSKTYGLYYQFGRKDPFTGEISIYDINGENEKNGLKSVLGHGPVTFAKAVNNPGTYYYNSTSPYDWASPQSKNRFWNDINNEENGTTKTFYDPCPEGWRLPNFDELCIFSGTWDAKKAGYDYKGNWFPATGWRWYDTGGQAEKGNMLALWTSEISANKNGDCIKIYKDVGVKNRDEKRATAMPLRCVKEN